MQGKLPHCQSQSFWPWTWARKTVSSSSWRNKVSRRLNNFNNNTKHGTGMEKPTRAELTTSRNQTQWGSEHHWYITGSVAGPCNLSCPPTRRKKLHYILSSCSLPSWPVFTRKGFSYPVIMSHKTFFFIILIATLVHAKPLWFGHLSNAVWVENRTDKCNTQRTEVNVLLFLLFVLFPLSQVDLIEAADEMVQYIRVLVERRCVWVLGVSLAIVFTSAAGHLLSRPLPRGRHSTLRGHSLMKW